MHTIQGTLEKPFSPGDNDVKLFGHDRYLCKGAYTQITIPANVNVFLEVKAEHLAFDGFQTYYVESIATGA